MTTFSGEARAGAHKTKRGDEHSFDTTARGGSSNSSTSRPHAVNGDSPPAAVASGAATRVTRPSTSEGAMPNEQRQLLQQQQRVIIAEKGAKEKDNATMQQSRPSFQADTARRSKNLLEADLEFSSSDDDEECNEYSSTSNSSSE